MTPIWRCWFWKLGLASFVAMGGAIASLGDCAIAQITPDGTLGAESSVVTPNVDINGIPSDQIDGGAIRGANLFHSFQEFNIDAGRGAYFSNPDAITNILSRVTGNDPSDILGRLGVLGNANLFLINSNGIIFGSNASLDLNGSFVGSTASSVNFADGVQFSATAPPPTPLLTISVPIGLQYGGNAGSIQVQGNGEGTRTTTNLIDTTVGLRVESNKTLALIGGDIALSGGTLKTAGGRIELGSVVGPGVVSLTPIDSGWALGYEGVPTFGDIQLFQQATVDASGAGGGNVQVQGRRVTLTNGSQIEATTLTPGAVGTLLVIASESVELSGRGRSAYNSVPSGLYAGGYPGATGDGANLTIETGRLIVRNGASLSTATFEQGDAGNITIQARDTVSFDRNSRADTTVDRGGVGNSGDINITSGSLSVTNGAYLSASTGGQGDAGNVNINAHATVSFDSITGAEYPSGAFSGVGAGAVGNGGDINITTDGSLSVSNGAILIANTYGQGNGGSVNINVRDSVSFDGESRDGFSSGAFSSVESEAVGSGGDININTRSLSLNDGAQLSAAVRGEIGSFPGGRGNGGSIRVNASDGVSLVGVGSNGFSSGLYTSTERGAIGQAGDITVATSAFRIADGATVSVSSFGTGNAGSIEVSANSIRLDNQGQLTAETASGDGGNITLRVQDLLLMRRNSLISAETRGTGNSGNIDINTEFLVAFPSENSDIVASANQGGNIEIRASGIFGVQFRESLTPESDITATGTVTFNTPDVDPSQGLVELPAELVDVSNQIAQGCPSEVGPRGSKFIITGRGGLPPSPNEPLRGDNVLTDWSTLDSDVENRSSATPATNPTIESAPTQIVEANGWVTNDKGEVFLTASAPTATLDIPWLPPSDCNASEPEV